MPTYDYVCAACGAALEIFQSMSEAPKKKCPQCGKSKLERRIGAGAGFIFKGGGFYQTDYRSSSYKSGEKAEAGSASKPADAAETTAKTESTPPPSSKSETTNGESKAPSESNPNSTAKSAEPKSPSKSRSNKKR